MDHSAEPPTGSIADAAPNEATNAEQLKAILSERPLNERRRRARSASAADAVLAAQQRQPPDRYAPISFTSGSAVEVLATTMKPDQLSHSSPTVRLPSV